MATLRTAAPSISTIFRFSAQPAATRRCAHCLKAQRCPFSSFRPKAQSSKRPLMTESAHRPQTLGPEMPPPKNSGSPDTSISAGQHQTWPPTAPWERKDGGSRVSEREGEAQKSKPTVASMTGAAAAKPSTTPEAAAAKPKKSKLRPRKAPITLTPKAIEQLQALFDQPESKLIRVGVKNRGCSGLAYHLEYVDKPGAFDETVEQDGVKVLIDSKALFSIIGSEMDWLEDKLSARFIFKNPNITEQCGCGESFSIS
ncbi:Iron-sulfur assembly 1 [Lecanosticta acicola]|uniref:Iron-sulfur assembly protein 1 n=1 Tax=Lecanosticta acicola TaxID=111012 RepID=A0AAI9EFT5_9PEZI|nr:Iron-sulfur assembly 1 [Lecanosticta acicola]